MKYRNSLYMHLHRCDGVNKLDFVLTILTDEKRYTHLHLMAVLWSVISFKMFPCFLNILSITILQYNNGECAGSINNILELLYVCNIVK
jgi:hypothetical protein